MDEATTRPKLTLKICRHTSDSEPYGYMIMIDGKINPIASAGVYTANQTLIVAPEYRHLPWASEYYTPEELEALAALIVRAVNAHDDLIAACKMALNMEMSIQPNDVTKGRNQGLVDVLLAALSAAQPATPEEGRTR